MDISLDNVIPELQEAAAEVMAVEDITVGEQDRYRAPAASKQQLSPTALFAAEHEPLATPAGAVKLRGRLLVPPEQAYARLAERLMPLGRTPVLRGDGEDGRAVLLALPGTLREARPNTRLAVLLFALTVLSSLFVGAQMVGTDAPTLVNTNLLEGVPFAASLLAILLAHEFGHYLVARRLGMAVSLPYFIPMPIGPFGTLGAFINMVAPPRNRRHLFAMAIAGPLAGLIVAIPVLWIGLGLSQVAPLPAGGYQMEGNSLLYLGLKYLMFGRILPSGGEDVFIHPIAFAGWAGLLVTALNLIPAGQLDGGHIFYAVAGERGARIMLWVVLFGLAALSFVWPGWLLWVALVFLFGRVRVPPLDGITGLTPGQRLLGALMLVVFVLVFTPAPLVLVP